MVNGNTFLTLFGGPAIFGGSFKQDDLPKYGFSDLIRMEILQIWSEVSFNHFMTSHFDHYLSSSLWHNSLIKIDNRLVFYKSWCAKGVKNVAYLMKDSTTFLSLTSLINFSASNQIFWLFKVLYLL